MTKLNFSTAVIIAISFHLASPTAFAFLYTDMIVFGDSLSDTGNLEQGGLIGELISDFAGVGATGTFSNGPIWHDYLADGLGMPRVEPSRDGGDNYAIGGAQTDRGGAIDGFWADLLLGQQTGIEEQVEIFIQGLPPSGADPEALYILWGGANDMRGESGPDFDVIAAPAVNLLGQHVQDLAAVGVHNLLVPNLPNLGRTPESISQGIASVAEAEAISRAFNGALQTKMEDLTSQHSLNLMQLDVFSALEEVMIDPQSFGFSNATDPCPDPESACTGYLFWDDIHPTTAAHEFLGQRAIARLFAPHIGDMDCVVDVDFDDIDKFVLGLNSPAIYLSTFGLPANLKGDFDQDGDLDFDDIDGFVSTLGGSSSKTDPKGIPEPSSWCLALVGLLGLAAASVGAVNDAG